MGKLFDKFNGKTYRNESAVTDHFVIPLFTEFLGYDVEELLPEERYPAKDLFKGVTKYESASKELSEKPDFIICIDGNVNSPKFLLDTKSPTEKIDNHLGQLQSYANAVGVNTLVITNGSKLKVFNVNELIFEADSVENLDLRLDTLKKIISRDVQKTKTTLEILKDIDLNESLNKSSKEIIDELKKKNKLYFLIFINT